MIKKINDLNKEEKLLLLTAIANGSVDKNCLNDDTLICVEKGGEFLGLLIIGLQEDKNSTLNIACIGEAEKAYKCLFDNILHD